MDLQATLPNPALEARQRTLAALRAAGIVAVVRTGSAASAVEVARALAAGGVQAIEVTFTVPGATEAIATLQGDQKSGRLPASVVLGVGTVLTAEQAQDAAGAGARFLVSPHTSAEVLLFARDHGLAALPGALTPGEVYTAWRQGGDIVKIFPAARMGPAYLKDLGGPYPEIPLMPTGGVNIENVGQWFAAGAVAVGVGGELVDRKAVRGGRWEELTRRARDFVKAIQEARRGGGA